MANGVIIKVIYAFISYLVGAIPFGKIISYVVSRMDIQEVGSGNIGATNVARVLGRKWGLITLIGDFGKGAIIVYIAQVIFNDDKLAALVAIVGVAGHCYPVYLRFKGGKGVATACGAFLVINAKAVGFSVLIFILVLLVTRIVSISSIMAALNFPVLTSALGVEPSLVYSSLIVALLITFQHRHNIRRLLRGEERTFSFKVK